MRLLAHLCFIVGLSVVLCQAAAFPICGRQALVKSVDDVLVPVRYYGPRDRRGHLEKAKELKLTKADVAQIKKSFGFFFCQPDPNKEPMTGGAFLAENNCEIWTVGHALQDENGAPVDLKYCGFQNFEVPGKRTSIDVSSKRNIVPWVLANEKGRIDRARLRLKECIPDAKPFLVEDMQMPVGTKYVAIMASNYDIPMSNEPILTPGQVEDVETLSDGTRLLYTSNDGDKGGSGGINVVHSRGRLAVRSINTQIASSLATWREGMPVNGAPFDRATNFNLQLELSGPVLKALQDPKSK